MKGIKGMKQMKRIGALIMAAALTLGTAMTVSATGTNPALPDPTEEGSITIHKYVVEDADDYTLAADGLQKDTDEVIATKGGNPVTIGDMVKLSNIEFTLELMKLKTGSPEGSADIADYEVDDTFTAVTDSTDAAGLLVFDELAQGIYRVTETESTTIRKACDPFLVSIPMTNPTDATQWIYDIHVYPKNELADGPDIDKSVTVVGNQHDTMNRDEEVTWIVRADIPVGIGAAQTYEINDNMNAIHSFLPSSLVFSAVNADGKTPITLAPLTAVTDYTLTHTPGTYPAADKFTVSFTKAGMTKLAAVNAAKTGTDMAKLVLTFNTEFKELTQAQWENELTTPMGKELENKADLKYVNEIGTTYTPVTEEPEVHLGGVKLIKVDANDTATALPGAKFKIYPTLADAKAGTNAIQDPDSVAAKEWEVTADADGYVRFYGLEFGTSPTGSFETLTQGTGIGAESSYWIVETKAPAGGYTMLKAPLEVKINKTSHLAANKVEVKNSKFNLPLTGGMGTMIFTILGLVLVIAGVSYAVVSRKKSARR